MWVRRFLVQVEHQSGMECRTLLFPEDHPLACIHMILEKSLDKRLRVFNNHHSYSPCVQHLQFLTKPMSEKSLKFRSTEGMKVQALETVLLNSVSSLSSTMSEISFSPYKEPSLKWPYNGLRSPPNAGLHLIRYPEP